MHAPVRYLTLCVAWGLIWSAGCGGSGTPADREPTVPVSGTVTYNGTPVEGARVVLIPDVLPGQTTNMKGAFGQTDSSGNFELMTYEAGDGAIAGSYKVTVSKYEGQPIEEEASEEDYAEPEPGYEPPAPKALLPTQYSNIRETPLKADITEGEPVTLDLKLTD